MVSVTPPTQIADVIASLTNPSPQRMLYQDAVFHDQLECRTPAGNRLRALMLEMAAIGRQRRVSGEPLQLPNRILQAEERCLYPPEHRHAPAAIFPNHPALQEKGVQTLEAEVGHLRRELARGRIIHDTDLHRTEAALHRTEDALHAIKSSLTWRLTRPLHRLLDAVRRTLEL